MDVVHYMQEKRRLCSWQEGICHGCPFQPYVLVMGTTCRETLDTIEQMVETLERWGDEHPRLTNGDMVRENVPIGTSIDYKSSQGRVRIEIPTEWWNAEYEGK